MSSRLLFKALLKERLVAAAEEIFEVFESTLVKYEEEMCRSKEEIERLRGLLKSPQRTDFLLLEDDPAGGPEQEPVLSDHQRDLELLIKEERREVWAGEQSRDDDRDPFRPQQPVLWETDEEEEDTKPEIHPQRDLRDSRPEDVDAPVASTSRVQDGRENQELAVDFTDDVQMDEDRGSFNASREAADVVQFCSAVSDFHCHLCDKPFSSNQFLINHAFRFHSRSVDVLCAVCGKTLESTENLIAHINSHKGPKCCHVCGKHCSSSTSLKEHVAGHAGVKLHCCPLCGKECGRKGDLKIHMRIHTGEKPFCCSFCCKSFTHSGHLKKHLRSHTGERPHRCGVCGKRFLQSTHLKSHMGTHTQKS